MGVGVESHADGVQIGEYQGGILAVTDGQQTVQAGDFVVLNFDAIGHNLRVVGRNLRRVTGILNDLQLFGRESRLVCQDRAGCRCNRITDHGLHIRGVRVQCRE